MEVLGVFAVLFLFVSVISVVILFLSSNKPTDTETPPPVVISATTGKPLAPPPPKPVIPQNNIYVYHHTEGKRICVYCDGENEHTLLRCRVCGQLFR